MAHTVQRIISIYKKETVVRHCSGIGLKGLHFRVEKHDPAVRLSTAYRNAESFACLQIRRAVAAADVSRARGGQTAIKALGVAQPEFDHRIVFSGEADACRFRRD